MNIAPESTLLGKRDHAIERSSIRPFLQWPLNVAYGLNSFQFFQAVNHITTKILVGFVNMVPFSNNSLGNSALEQNLSLTKFRNYHDKII